MNIFTFWFDPRTELTLRNRPDLSRRQDGLVAFEVIDGEEPLGRIVEVPHEDLVTVVGQLPVEDGAQPRLC